MLNRIDVFMGARVFLPLIIWWCRLIGISNYRLANYLSWIAGLLILYGLGRNGAEHGWTLFGIILAVMFTTFMVATRPESPSVAGPQWLRMVFYALALSEVVALFFGNSLHIDDIALLMFPAADYARMIDRIPPKRKKRKAAVSRAV